MPFLFLLRQRFKDNVLNRAMEGSPNVDLQSIKPNRFWLYSDVTSVNSVFASDKIINNIDNFGIKCLSYNKINAILCVLCFLFLNFLFNLGKHVN